MSETISLTREARWIFEQLEGLGLPVHRNRIPQPEPGEQVEFPAIVFRRQGGVDLKTYNGAISIVRSIWLVFVAGGEDTLSDLEPHADALHTALHVRRPIGRAVEGRLVSSCTRESEYYEPVVENGVEYERVGGIYKLLTTRDPDA